MILHSAFACAAALLSLASLTTIALAQNVPVITLSTPTVEFPEAYTYIENVRELPDGRVLMLERCDRVLRALDFSSGTERQVGRTGSGPGEYRLPGRLLPLAGDSSVIYDPGNRRYLIILPNGTPGGTFEPLPTLTERSGGTVIARSAFNAVASDGRGRLYSRESGLKPGDNGPVRADSAAIERWDRTSGKRDTVTFFDLLGPPGPINRDAEVPFTTGIQFAVDRDGRVALVHPRDYHVEFVSPAGRRTVGKPIAFPPVRVTDAHKTQWRKEQDAPCPATRAGVRQTITTPDGKTGTVFRLPTPEPKAWPEHLPPFLANAAIFAPDGMLWVRRTGAANDPLTFDVIDGSGTVVQRVALPPRSRLVGFGKTSLYVVRLDEDDLQYLRRYPLPVRSGRD